MSAVFVVLGDVARGSRMQCHALALASRGVAVDLVGYVETALPPRLAAGDGVVVPLLRGRSLAPSGPSLGLCLHRSASGLDLPMKVLDYFGAGLPVCALNYGPCLAELVRDGENGFLFKTSDALARLLTHLCASPAGRADLARLQPGVQASRAVGWEESWEDSARPVLLPGLTATRRATTQAPA